MLSVVQRVSSASVSVEHPSYYAEIQYGLCVFLGVEEGDDKDQATWMARKLANLRIFQDKEGKMNRSVKDIGGEILLISQFTLAGDCNAGNRPSFIAAAKSDVAEPLVNLVGEMLQHAHDVPLSTGIFGAIMKVSIVNEGPVTLVIKRD